jgi:CheY-like chemotaxis protein
MSASIHLPYRIAVIDSDALQRLCTTHTLQASGIVAWSAFERPEQLAVALRAGQQFDLVLVGLHADAAEMMVRLRQIPAVERGLPLMYLAHRSELAYARPLLAPGWPADAHPQLLLSPMEDRALGAMLQQMTIGGAMNHPRFQEQNACLAEVARDQTMYDVFPIA